MWGLHILLVTYPIYNNYGRQSAACELIHSAVIFAVGLSAGAKSSHVSTTTHVGVASADGLRALVSNLFPTMLRLATDVDGA